MSFTLKIIVLGLGGLIGFIVMLAHPAGPLMLLLAVSPFDAIFFGLAGTAGNTITYVPVFMLLLKMSPGAWTDFLIGTRIQMHMLILMMILIVSHVVSIPTIGPVIGWEYARKVTLLFLVAIFAWTFRDARHLEPCVKVVVVSMTLYTVLSALDHYFGIRILPNPKVEEIGGIIGEEFESYRTKEWRFAGASLPVNRYGNWMLLPTILAAGWATLKRSRFSRLVAVGCLLILLGGIAGTLSRSAAGCVIIATGILAVTAWRMNPMQVIGFGVAAGMVAGVVYFVLTLAAVDQAIATRFAPKEVIDSIEGRLARTGTGFLIWAQSPIIGVGDAMFKRMNKRQHQGTNAHNAYISILAEAGLLGFIPWMLLLLFSLRRLMARPRDDIPEPLQYWRPFFLAGFVVLCISMYTAGYEYERWLWFTMAFAAVLERADVVARHRAAFPEDFGEEPAGDDLPGGDLTGGDLPGGGLGEDLPGDFGDDLPGGPHPDPALSRLQ